MKHRTKTMKKRK